VTGELNGDSEAKECTGQLLSQIERDYYQIKPTIRRGPPPDSAPLSPCDLRCRKRHRPWLGVFRRDTLLRVRTNQARRPRTYVSLHMAACMPAPPSVPSQRPRGSSVDTHVLLYCTYTARLSAAEMERHKYSDLQKEKPFFGGEEESAKGKTCE